MKILFNIKIIDVRIWIGCCLFFFLFSCEDKLGIEVRAEVEEVDYIVSSIGFSTRGARGYFKQKVYINYFYNDSLYEASFIGDKSLGKFKRGDTVIIQLKENPMEFEVLKRISKYHREKFKPVKGTAK